MGSSGTPPRTTADEAFVGLCIDHALVDATFVDDVRAALRTEPNGMGLVEALIDSGVLNQEQAELFIDDLGRGVLSCPGCGGRFNVGNLAAGTRFKCKGCGGAVTVPNARVGREVLGRFGGDVEVEAAPEFPQATASAADSLSENELDAVLSGGTAEGQLIDFSEVDLEEESISPPKPAPVRRRKSGPRAKPARRSSRRTATEAGDDIDEFVDDGPQKDPDFWKRFTIWVIAPIVLMVLGIYFTPDIKRAMMGKSGSGDGRDRQRWNDTPERPYRPTIPADQSPDWKSALAAANIARQLLGEARTQLAAGHKDKAFTKFDAADKQFQRAFELYEEVVDIYESAADSLNDTVSQWVVAQEDAAKERAAAAGE